MRQVIRNNVFETNSSSVHTISISREGREPSVLPVDEDGYIITDYGTFDNEEKDFTSQADKLSYLITQCWYLCGWETPTNDNYHFEHVEDAICKYTGAEGIRILEEHEPEIDHQEQPQYDMNLVDEWDPNSIIDFVFNRYVTLHTDSD